MSAKYSTKIDLKPAIREQSIALLAPALAGATDLMLSAKEAHWNLKGPGFIALHGLFDGLNAAAAGYADELAERIVQLGGHAAGTLHATAKASKLPAYPEGKTEAEEHLKALASQAAALGALLRRSIDEAAEAWDAGTADLFTEISRSLDKQLWFLEAHLG